MSELTPSEEYSLGELECPSQEMQNVYRLASRLAATDLDVLLTGESGTGKEVLARRIHRNSVRAFTPLIKVRAPRLAADWLDSSLLGLRPHVPEWLNLAERGDVTLYLDELTELNGKAQAALLHLLLDREQKTKDFKATGRSGARILAATSFDLRESTAAGKLRRDLLLHLGAVGIRIPPLRDRPEDIFPLIEHFLGLLPSSDHRPVGMPVDPRVVDAILKYPWPGNVRELRNFVRRITQTDESPETILRLIGLESEAATDLSRSSSLSLAEASRRATQAVERQLIVKALEENGWNRKLASEKLHVSYRVLLDKIRRLQIS